MDHQVFDGEDVIDVVCFPRPWFLPLLGHSFIEHYVPRDHHLASPRIVEPIGLATLVLA
jgi:hypothetical protein